MELQTFLVFISDNKQNIDKIEKCIDTEDITFNVEINSTDVLSQSNNYLTVKIELIDDSEWINISHIMTELEKNNISVLDVLVISTDCIRFADILSKTGTFDITVDNDADYVYYLSDSYEIPYYDPEDISDDDSEDDNEYLYSYDD